MTTIDLKGMSISALRALINDAEREISNKENEARRNLLSQMNALAKEAGFSSAEDALANSPKSGKKVASAPKYRHPGNPETTWTGRGRQPAWIKEALESGKSLEDFAI